MVWLSCSVVGRERLHGSIALLAGPGLHGWHECEDEIVAARMEVVYACLAGIVLLVSLLLAVLASDQMWKWDISHNELEGGKEGWKQWRGFFETLWACMFV